jgi:hypothetical protein
MYVNKQPSPEVVGRWLTFEQACSLEKGDMLYSIFDWNADGTNKRWHVTSVKRWKRQPNRILVKLRHGLKTFRAIDAHGLMGYRTQAQQDAWAAIPEDASTLTGLVKRLQGTPSVVFSLYDNSGALCSMPSGHVLQTVNDHTHRY